MFNLLTRRFNTLITQNILESLWIAHLTKLAKKVPARANFVRKLTDTNWGTSAETLRIMAYAYGFVVYSTAEYCAPMWLNSAHVSKIDVQLNNAMHLDFWHY
jgi:hypothetical protein